MTTFNINHSTKETILNSFDNIAYQLLNQYAVIVNNHYYRMIDIEFYYFAEADSKYLDVYAHKHIQQLQNGKWYFHGSGVDITIGDESHNHYGGILIRALVKLDENGSIDTDQQIHGPINVKTEICANFNKLLDATPNIFCLSKVNVESASGFKGTEIFKTKRIGLNKEKRNRFSWC